MSHDHTQMSKDFYVGKILSGNYLVDRLVGKGGMAWVYKAEHVKFNEPMALKILLPHISDEPEIRVRFLEEARIQFKLKHPNIVQVTDVIEDGPTIAIVMEWIGGENLKQLLRKLQRPISRKDIWRIIGPILDAIGYAHRQGLVHRDIKPANIMLHTEGERLVPKIADFGIAKVLDEAMEGRTATGMTMGTLKFMPPEQIRDSKRVDHRADIYSLGATLYVMATRRLPFLGKGDWVVYQQLNEDPPPPSSFNPSISDAFDQVVLRCMDKRPEMRYQSCAELAQALSLALLDPANIKRLSTQEINSMDIYNMLVSMPEESSVYSSSVELISPAMVVPMPAGHTDPGLGSGTTGTAAPPQGPYNQPGARRPTATMGSFNPNQADDTGNTGNTGNTGTTGTGNTNNAQAPTTPGVPHMPAPHTPQPQEPPQQPQSFPAPAPPAHVVSQTDLSQHESQSGLSYSAISQIEQGPSANSLVFKTAGITMLLMLAILGAGVWFFSARDINSSTKKPPPNTRHIVFPRPLIPGATPCTDGVSKPCYTGPAKTANQGICKKGVQLCKAGKWQACSGQVLPLAEEKCNGADDNCNGQVDEAFAQKGKACKAKVGDCPVVGKMACRANGNGLFCRSKGGATSGRGRLMLQVSPGRIKVFYRGRRRSVNRRTCLAISRSTRLTFLHPRYYKCILSVTPKTRRLRIRMKRKNTDGLDPPVSYCRR